MFNNSSHIDASRSAFTEVHQSQYNNVGGMIVQGNQTTYTVVHGNQIIRLAGEGYSGLGALHKASTTNAAFDSAQRFPAPSCLPGTRVEILSLISSWVNDDSPHSICWLNGLAGSGKSAIAQTIAEMYAAEHRLVASFFFSRREMERGTTQRFVPTIATHFMAFSPSLKPAIIRALEEDFTIPTKVLREQMMKLLFEPFVSLSAQMTQTESSTQINTSPPVLLVIDSLDECDNERLVSEIISLIPQLIQECPFPLKVLLTSRPEPHLKAAFRTSEILSVTRSLELRSFDAETDIRLFLRKSFTMIRDQRQSTLFGNSGPWPSESELEALVQKASGLFIYATTTINFIGNKHRDPRKQLVIILSNIEGSDSGFADLDTLYRDVISVPLNADLTRLILGIIRYTSVPLSIQGMDSLLEAGELNVNRDVGSLVQELSSVLLVPDHYTEPLGIYHASFRDFLSSPERAKEYFVDAVVYHRLIAELCLKVMNASLKRDICGLGDSYGLNSNIEDLPGRCSKHMMEAFRYSCCYWAYHLARVPHDAEGKLNARLTAALHELIGVKLLYWLEGLSLLGSFDGAVTMLQDAAAWLKNESHKLSADALGILNDTERLVLMFFDPISQSALHVYRTALPFIPSSTKLRQLVQAESDLSSESGISVRFGLEGKWDACTRTISVNDPLTSVAFSPDGKLIASASEEIGVQLWNAVTGTNVANVGPGPSDKTSCPVKFSPSGAYVGVGSTTGLVTIWDALTAQIVVSDRHRHSKPVTFLVFSPDGELAASTSKDGRIQLWAVRTGDPRHQLQHTEAVQSVAFSSDNQMLISGSDDNTIGVWDVVSGDLLKMLKGHSDAITCVAFSDDNRLIASGSKDRSVRIWEVNTGKCVRTHSKINKEDVNVVRFTPNGKHVIFICDGVLGFAKVSSSLLGGNSFQSIWTPLKFYTKAISRTLMVTTTAAPFLHSRYLDYSIATDENVDIPIQFGFSGEGEMTVPVFAFSAGSLVFLTSALAPVSSLLPAFHSFSHECTAIAISSNGDRVASGNEEGTIQIWDPTLSLKNWGEFSDNLKAATTNLITSPNGRFFLVKSLFELKLKDEYGTTIKALNVGDVDIQRVNEIDALFAPDSNTFAYWAGEGTLSTLNSYSLRIHSSATGRRIARFAKLDKIWCVGLVTADDGQNLVAIAHGSVIEIWDVRSGKSVCTLRPKFKADDAGTDDDNNNGIEAGADADVDRRWSVFFTSLAFSDNGASIVCGTSTGEAYLFDVRTSELRAEIEGREPRITHIVVSPTASSSQQDQLIALGYADGSIDLWSPSQSTKAHSSHFEDGCARSRGVSEVETASDLEQWGLTHELTSDDCFPSDIELLVFAADGTRLMCRSSDESVSVWAVPPISEGDPCALCEGAGRIGVAVEPISADDANAQVTGTSNNMRINPHLISASWDSSSAQDNPLPNEIYYDCLFRAGYVVLSDGWVMHSRGLGAEPGPTQNHHQTQKRILWLPAALRPSGPTAFAAYRGKLVILTMSHRIVFLELKGTEKRIG